MSCLKIEFWDSRECDLDSSGLDFDCGEPNAGFGTRTTTSSAELLDVLR